ncbi:MAG: PCP reductase family protein, partial [Nevskia sp.]|nr:PCP reductase family protein [Nevskia sp.]
PSRLISEMPWLDDAKAELDEWLELQPVLVRISAAKRLRDRAEADARRAGEDAVTAVRLLASRRALTEGAAA